MIETEYGIVAITRGGIAQGKKLRNLLGQSSFYTLPDKLEEGMIPVYPTLKLWLKNVFEKHKTWIFIMATGIVVRCLDGLLKGKQRDPGVIVMDEGGNFAISLLSGHLGGANRETEKIARLTGACPVITTATDIQGKPAVDTISMLFDCMITDMVRAKEITARMVNGEKAGIKAGEPLPCGFDPPERGDVEIIITNKKIFSPEKNQVWLIPRNIIAGIGCCRGIPGKKIIRFVEEEMDRLNLHPLSLKKITSLELKKDEPGLKECAAHFSVPFKVFSAGELSGAAGRFPESSFVKKITGLGSVSAPCAFLGGGGKGRMLLSRARAGGITLSLWEKGLECRRKKDRSL